MAARSKAWVFDRSPAEIDFESDRGHGCLSVVSVLCCDCCVLLGRVLCDELLTRSEESYRLWCIVVCDLETS